MCWMSTDRNRGRISRAKETELTFFTKTSNNVQLSDAQYVPACLLPEILSNNGDSKLLSRCRNGEYRNRCETHDTFGCGPQEGALERPFALKVQDNDVHVNFFCDLKNLFERFSFVDDDVDRQFLQVLLSEHVIDLLSDF